MNPWMLMQGMPSNGMSGMRELQTIGNGDGGFLGPGMAGAATTQLSTPQSYPSFPNGAGAGSQKAGKKKDGPAWTGPNPTMGEVGGETPGTEGFSPWSLAGESANRSM